MLTEDELKHIVSECVDSYGAIVDTYFVNLSSDGNDEPMQKFIGMIKEAEKENNKTKPQKKQS